MKVVDLMGLTFRNMCSLLLGSLFYSAIAGAAQAGFALDFLGTTPSGANTAYNYNLVFTTTSGQESISAGTGTLSPGVIGTQDFVSIYDIPGFISTTTGAFFTAQMQFVGVNGPFTSPADDSLAINIAYRYSGPNLSADTIFAGFSILSTFATPGLDNYTSQRTDNFGLDAGTKIGEVGLTTVPMNLQAIDAVPEPSAFALWGLGALGCALAGYRRRKLA